MRIPSLAKSSWMFAQSHLEPSLTKISEAWMSHPRA